MDYCIDIFHDDDILKELAEKGDDIYQYLYGTNCLRRQWQESNDPRKEGEYWLTKSAEQGFIPAQLALADGYLYQFQNNLNTFSYTLNLLTKLRNGEEIGSKSSSPIDMTDYSKSLYWYLQAAERDDGKGMFCVGWFYETGNGGVQEDFQRAIEYYIKSADSGYLPAQIVLGQCYAAGNIINKDLPKSVSWYRRAAEQGELRAQNIMGVCATCGIGLEKNTSLAVSWFMSSARQGNSDAQKNLAQMYEYGIGVELDTEIATFWKHQAERNNYKNPADPSPIFEYHQDLEYMVHLPGTLK